MAKLVDVMKENQILNRRQLPLVIDENLTMVLDLSGLNLVCDNVSVRGRQLEDFMKKYSILSLEEVATAFQVTYKHCLEILNQTVPCIGCRKSVERVFTDLSQSGYPALSPLLITEDGILTIQQDYLTWPNHLCSLLHGHSTKLNSLAASWPGGRGKAARRCVLHSLDSARYATRPPLSSYAGGGGWREAWDAMRAACKEQVVLIEACVLLATLETYLRKHRFCGECRTKVMRAYTLLVEEKEPQKEKGFVAPLYAGIRRCLADKHIHLELRTEFIGSLIARAEPELIGNRRERHAKTLEIAQEEVLTCIGICVYERLHKIQMKLREEQCTYQVLATVAVEALCRNFETVVEEKQGVSQLELCYLDMIRDDQVKQQRRELKKLKKRKRREERKLQLMKQQLAKETFECENCAEVYTEDEEHACPSPPPPPTTTTPTSKVSAPPSSASSTKPKSSRKGPRTPEGSGGKKGSRGGGLKENGSENGSGKSKSSKAKRKAYTDTKAESVDTDENCVCDECSKETSSLKVKKLLSSAASQKKTKTSNAQSDSILKTSAGPNISNGGDKVSKKSSAGDSQVESFTSSKKSSKQAKKSKSSAENTTRTSGLQSTSSASSVNSVDGMRDAFGNLSNDQVRDGCGNHSDNQDRYAFGNLSNNNPMYGNPSNNQVRDTCGNPSNNVRIAFGNPRNNRDTCGNHSNNNVKSASHSNTFGSHGNATECSIGSDGGYTSGNNSTLSSPANSEVACSDGFCNHEGPEDCPADSSTGVGSECDDVTHLFHSKLSLEQMLHSNGCHGDGCCDDGDEDEDEGECWIPREEVEKFRARVQNVEEKRQRLRATLMQRFQNMCDRSRCPF